MKKHIDELLRELVTNLVTNGANYQKYAIVVQRFLDKIGWRYSIQYDDSAVVFVYGVNGFKGVYDSFRCALRVDSGMLKSVTLSPISMEDGNNVEEIMEFITRANMQLKFGAFKLDFNQNKVLFDIAFPVEIIEIEELDTLEEVLNLELLLTYGAKMFDSYSYGFAKIIMGELTPEEAIRYSNEIKDQKI